MLQFPQNEQGMVKLEEYSFNDRSIVVWYDVHKKLASLMLFHLTDQVNEQAQKSPYTTWGYCTGILLNQMTIPEAGVVISKYIRDMENENYWWEV